MLQFLSRGVCVLYLTTALLVISGCDAAPEDRTISFSSDGRSAGFQHGNAGVFVTDAESGRLVQLFTPDEGVLACSSPLFAPGRERLIFTTARAVGENAQLPPEMNDWNEHPEGRAFLPQEIVYTCWLREDADSAPVELFKAHCDHAGYVAANLAVRWHPQQDRIAYIDQVGPQQLTVFEYDLKSKAVRRMFPFGARAVLFDWDPQGKLMSCLIDDPVNGVPEGLWIGDPESADWRNVPGPVWDGPSVPVPMSVFMGMRPAWTAEGDALAFTAPCGKSPEGKPMFGLFVSQREGTLSHRVAESPRQLVDLRWSADGALLGGRNPETARLALYGRDGRGLEESPVQQVAQFAGWNSSGDRLAYVAAARPDIVKDPDWAFLLRVHPHARDVLMVTDRQAQQAGTTAFSGMRVTFANWSPEPQRISFWGTFVPVVQNWWEWGGLRRGDPAAVINLETGKVTWMPVNAAEKAQVGHWCLAQRKYADADKWYQAANADEREAAQKEAAPAPAAVGNPLAVWQPRGWQFFHAYCLSKLGREAEADELYRQFRESYQPFAGDEPDVRRALASMVSPDDPQQVALLTDLLRNLYAAQVFLSLNAVDEGVAWFRSELAKAETEGRLVLVLPLSQMLLLTGQRAEYVELASREIVPLAVAQAATEPATAGQLPQMAVPLSTLLALLPVCSAEFLAELPVETVVELADRWEELQPRAQSDQSRLGIALLREAAARRLGKVAEADVLAAEIRANPLGGGLSAEGIGEFVKLLRGLQGGSLLQPGVR
jgi:hypothetical protein